MEIQQRLYIGGRFVPAEDGATLPSLNPHDNTPLADVSMAGKADVDKAVEAARAAFPRWSRTAAAERGRLLLKLADKIEERAEELARLETEVPGLYVAGDIAEYDSPLLDGPARIEHWDVAFNQAKTAARNMTGQDVPHEEIPYFWSDLSDWTGLEYVGAGAGGDDRVIRGSIDDGSFTAFSLAGGRVMSAVTVGRSDDLEHARRMIRERSKPDAAALADESTNLGEL